MAAIHAGCQSTPIAAVAMRAGAVGGLNGRGPVAAHECAQQKSRMGPSPHVLSLHI